MGVRITHQGEKPQAQGLTPIGGAIALVKQPTHHAEWLWLRLSEDLLGIVDALLLEQAYRHVVPHGHRVHDGPVQVEYGPLDGHIPSLRTCLHFDVFMVAPMRRVCARLHDTKAGYNRQS